MYTINEDTDDDYHQDNQLIPVRNDSLLRARKSRHTCNNLWQDE